MPLARISGLGDEGFMGDQPPYSLPDNALSGGQNVRAYHGRLTNFPGHLVYANPPIEVHGLFGFEALTVGALLWTEAGLSQVFVYDGSTHTEITRLSGNYNANEYFDRWTGGVQNGIGFLANGSDFPQQWDKVDPGTRLRDMFWDANASAGQQTWAERSYNCFAMRSYGKSIFALGMRFGSDDQPGTVAWSDFVAPNNPNLVFEPSATNSAGSIGLGDTLGACIDGAPLRNDFIIYKEDSAWRASETQSANQPFVFERLPNYVRILNRGCIGVTSEFHVVAAPEDVYLFDGNKFRSILTRKERKFYRSQLWGERKLNAFVAVLDQEQQAWICFTTPGSAGETKYPDQAIVWCWADNTFSRTELPQVRSMSPGPLTQSTFSLTIDQLTDPIDSYTQAIDSLGGEITPADSWLVGAHGSSNLSVFGIENTDNGTPRECLAERIGLVLQDPQSGIRSTDAMMRLKEVRPYIEASQPVFIQIGAQDHPNDAVRWEPEKSFNPQTQAYLTFRSTGRYFGYRVRSQANMAWEMTDIGFTYHPQRRR